MTNPFEPGSNHRDFPDLILASVSSAWYGQRAIHFLIDVSQSERLDSNRLHASSWRIYNPAAIRTQDTEGCYL